MANENQLTSTANASFHHDLREPFQSASETPIAPVVAGHPTMNPEEIQRGGKKKRSKRRKTIKRKKKSTRSKSKSRSRSSSKSRRRSRRGGHCGCEGKRIKKRGGSVNRPHRRKRSKKGKKKRGGNHR